MSVNGWCSCASCPSHTDGTKVSAVFHCETVRQSRSDVVHRAFHKTVASCGTCEKAGGHHTCTSTIVDWVADQDNPWDPEEERQNFFRALENDWQSKFGAKTTAFGNSSASSAAAATSSAATKNSNQTSDLQHVDFATNGASTSPYETVPAAE
ncbi:hypothetical protein I316_02664 [Kwoniella heveanensis BCC8398]|uniref:Uncharacterized protein n=1 Tax=Kwoniella heveanensis BCC8398 TaxID=1296120 RepID=A0A1B9GX75_9TREE|nr:hypothetical protein I316_02664 [Kwoniella heveanensis BCC8398]